MYGIVGVGRLLAPEVLVQSELVNVRCVATTDGGHGGSAAICRNPVELLARDSTVSPLGLTDDCNQSRVANPRSVEYRP